MLKEQSGKRKPPEGSPSDTNFTEGFGVEEFQTFLGFSDPPAETTVPLPPANPLGGRPTGSTIQASRDAKKVIPFPIAVLILNIINIKTIPLQ